MRNNNFLHFYKVLSLFLFICLSISCAGTKSAGTSKNPLLSDSEYSRLTRATGSDWDITLMEDEIIITSRIPCWFYIGVSLPPMEEDEFIEYVKTSGRTDYYTIRLLFVQKWDKDTLETAQKKNEQIRDEIDQLAEKLGISHLMRTKTNSFFPETKADEEKVALYDKKCETLMEKLIPLPDYHSEYHSIFMTDNRMGFEAVWYEDIPFINFNLIFPDI